ncbi:MAG: glutathione S-transferase family protein [Pseudomonadota bacterium]|nr:glutathione S-transferase family protein [Pseudomonadota bacterium]
MTDLILHHYWPSPFAHKVRLALALAGTSWTSVEIPRVPPKPLLMPLTANYRRTPVMQIGADIHCDTQNIARALAEAGHEDRLFPSGSRGRAMAISGWIDQAIAELAVRVVITSAIGTAPAEFIRDRGDLYFGPGWTEDGLKAGFDGVVLQLGAQLAHAESMLADTGYLDGSTPSWPDVTLAFVAWFLRGRWDGGGDLLSRYPHIEKIEAELASDSAGSYREMTAEEALAVARAATPQSPRGIDNPACNLAIGQRVVIRPRGASSDPDITGQLRFMDMTRLSIDHESDETGAVAVHLPLAGYAVRTG